MEMMRKMNMHVFNTGICIHVHVLPPKLTVLHSSQTL